MIVLRCGAICKELKLHIALIFVQIAFSTVNIWGEIGLEYLEPLPFNCLRYIISLPFALVLAIIFEMDSLKESFSSFWNTFKNMGLLGLSLSISLNLYFYGLKFSNPINTGTLYLAAIPVTAAIGMILNLEERMLLKVLGVCLSLAGALVMVGVDQFSISSQTTIGDLLVLGMVIFYSLYLVFTRKLSSGLKPFTISFWIFFYAGLFCLIPFLILYLSNVIPITHKQFFSSQDWMSVLIVCLIGTTFTYILNNWALTETTSLVVAIYTPLELLCTVILGILILNLQFKWQQGVGAGLIVLGLVAVIWAKRIEQQRKMQIFYDDYQEEDLTSIKS